jgi:hypothetical protein
VLVLVKPGLKKIKFLYLEKKYSVYRNMESRTSYIPQRAKIILTSQDLLNNYASFDEILKDSGIKDEKMMDELQMTAPTFRSRKKQPKSFTIAELDTLALLLTNGKSEIPVVSLVEYIRAKHLI